MENTKKLTDFENNLDWKESDYYYTAIDYFNRAGYPEKVSIKHAQKFIEIARKKGFSDAIQYRTAVVKLIEGFKK